MTYRLQIFLTGFAALIMAALFALAPAGANPTSGGYQLFEQTVPEHQAAIQLASLGNFDYHAKTASEYANARSRTQLIDDLASNGTRITPEDVVDIRKLPDGRTVWLETGSDGAGLQHIYKRHEVDFANKGIPRGEVPIVIMNALERGNVVGTNGSANVYRISHNGVEHNIAIGVGSNGFVVRANPVSSWKALP